jgi:hypothetical protein
MRALVLVVASAALAGCSLGADEEPKAARGVASEVGVVIAELQRSVARGNYRALCDDIFTAVARRRSGGSRCPRLLRSRAGAVRRPRVELTRLAVRGDAATARVRTRAAGQPPRTDVVELRREGGEWRIEAVR